MSIEVTAKPKAVKAKSAKADFEYIEGIGRRKTAVARVRAAQSAKSVYTINDKTVEEYFPTAELRAIATSPLDREGFPGKYTVTVRVSGSGIHSQAEAIRHGLSRILVEEDPTQKKELKKLGFLKRDSRKKERKHFGLKKARKASQWSKR
jgi:small subunit ribosomal protein S9